MKPLVTVSRAVAPANSGAIDPVGLSWLVIVRWTTLLACAGAMVAGKSALDAPVPVTTALGLLTACGLSNLWLMWRVRAGRTDTLVTQAGLLVCVDVVVLSWLLFRSGGVLNPASVFYLAQIVVAALVLGRRWTWIVSALSVTGYAALFLVPSDELVAAQVMHPEIALHMRGMWLAFALTALIIAVLVARLAIAVERRDRALEELRDRNARTERAAGLATLAAGAAHELSTPLSTIAVAASELERRLNDRNLDHLDASLQQDARLIRSETDRCRQILDAMAGQSGEPAGQTPRPSSLAEVIDALRARLAPAETRSTANRGQRRRPRRLAGGRDRESGREPAAERAPGVEPTGPAGGCDDGRRQGSPDRHRSRRRHVAGSAWPRRGAVLHDETGGRRNRTRSLRRALVDRTARRQPVASVLPRPGHDGDGRAAAGRRGGQWQWGNEAMEQMGQRPRA